MSNSDKKIGNDDVIYFRPHDRGTFLASSRSDPEGDHIVDVVEQTCSCKGFSCRKFCEHLRRLDDILETETEEGQARLFAAAEAEFEKRVHI